MPLDGTTAAVMADAGLHPFLELTLGTGKSLASVLRHLATKWAAAAAGVGSSLPYVHPPADGPLPLRGVRWGGPDCGSEMKVRAHGCAWMESLWGGRGGAVLAAASPDLCTIRQQYNHSAAR